jgi:hypothetical protein
MKMMKKCIAFCACLMLALPLLSQSRFPLTNKTIQTELYQAIDLVYETSKLDSNAFDVDLGAVFTSPSKQVLRIQGFYNGKREYIIRFSPKELGEYHFESFGIQKKLMGHVNVADQSLSDKRPQVQQDPQNSQRFQYANGKPYFALAFELDWLFALDYNQKELKQSKSIVESIRANGFNQVVMNVYAYDVSWPADSSVPKRYEFRKPNYSIFEGTNDKPDFEQLNVEFFQQLDRKIQLLHEHGIVAHLMIYVWNKKVNWPAMYSAADNRYFDYVIKRYQAYPNVIWDVSKEALDYGRCDIPYINERIARIRKNDAYKHLLTVHDYEYCSREPEKVDFISIQNWRSDLYMNSIEAAELYPDKPVMNIEHGGYEKGPFASFVGNYVNPKVCLERNYACVFAGVYSSYYWQNAAWNMIIYDVFQQNQYPKPQLEYYQHLQSLFANHAYNEFKAYKPKLTINSRLGNDNFSTSGYALSNGKGVYLYFVPKENDFVNTVIPRPASGRVRVTQMNIFTGERQVREEAYQLFKSYTSPWKGEAYVLQVEALSE